MYSNIKDRSETENVNMDREMPLGKAVKAKKMGNQAEDFLW